MDYKKILEGVVNIINTTEKSDIGFVNICTYIGENCPELAESEDERIRKDLLGYLHTLPNHFSHNGSLVTEWVAWLEKQGEQKPAEWSEEDKDMLGMLLEMINYASDHYQHDDKATDIKAWVLKSLRQKLSNVERTGKNWRPSDEQMKVLDVAIKSSHLTTAEYNGLVKLREQLKKL